jgi:hypothetical protein
MIRGSDMKLWQAGLVISALSLAAAGAPAYATSITYDWTVSGVGTSGEVPPGAGTVTVTSETNGADPVTAITGEIAGVAITGLGSTSGGADNLLYPNGSPTVLDLKGLALTTASGNLSIISQFQQGSTLEPGEVNLDEFLGSAVGGFAVGNLTLAPVPLPASWTLFLLGLAGLQLPGLRSRASARAVSSRTS